MNDRLSPEAAGGNKDADTVMIENGQLMEVRARVPAKVDPQENVRTDVVKVTDLYRPLPEPLPLDPSPGIRPHQ